MVWPGDQVTQNYNDANEVAGIDGSTILQNTHATWNNVSTFSFSFILGDPTTICPSLVLECAGQQAFDGANGVGWVDLGGKFRGGIILGVTWFGEDTAGPEADMALNTRVNWSNSCQDEKGKKIDAETVVQHENGHVLGLDHSSVRRASMFPSYQAADCSLDPDDEEGITFLYDSSVTGSVSGTVTASGSLVHLATVVLEGTSFSAITDVDGTYTISDIPDPVTYDVTASAAGLSSSTVGRLPVSGTILDVDFSLTSGRGGGGVHVADTNPTVHPKNGQLRITHVIHDSDGNPIAGATVESNLNHDGNDLGIASGTTNDNGEVTFKLKGRAPNGDYISTVVDVTGDGVTFSPCNTRTDGSMDESTLPYNITDKILTEGAPIDDCSP